MWESEPESTPILFSFSFFLHAVSSVSKNSVPRSGMYGPSRGTIVMQSLIGHTLTQSVHPVQSVVISGMCVSAENVMAW
jgi:hypothetical protein